MIYSGSFVLSLSGEYVAVEKVEEIYKKCSSIDQIWVYGNSYKSCLVAVVVPQPKYVQSWASQNGGEGSNEDTIKMEGFKKSLLDEMTAIAKAGGLKGFEIVKVRAFGIKKRLFFSPGKLVLFVSVDLFRFSTWS